MKYHVWSGNDLFVMVFKEDTEGNVLGITDEHDPDPFEDTPVYTYCIANRAEVSGSHNVSRKPSTGRTHKKLVPEDYDYSGSVDHMYLKKDEIDRENVFSRKQFLSVYFLYLSYMRQPSTNKEWHALRRCMATSFTISSSNSEHSTCAVQFMAEDYSDS